MAHYFLFIAVLLPGPIGHHYMGNRVLFETQPRSFGKPLVRIPPAKDVGLG